MDDDTLDPAKDIDETEDADLDDDLLPGAKKAKGPKDIEDASLDELADEEEEVLPEDSYDDVDLF